MATGRVPTTANSPLTAKGDLFGYSTTQARVPVGNDGETLVADSSASTGLRWQGSAIGKNAIINGACEIAQRGTAAVTLTAANFLYPIDRWFAARPSGTSGATAQQISSIGLDGFQYAVRLQRTNGNTSTNDLYLGQTLESANSIPFANKTVTVSFWARAGSNYSGASNGYVIRLYSGTGTDQSAYGFNFTGAATPINQTITLTTSWQRFQLTGTIASTATQLQFFSFYTPTGTAGANDYVDMTGLQLELGSVATPFSRSSGTLAGERSACERYYWRTANNDAGTYTMYGGGMSNSTTDNRIYIKFPTTMRTAPTSYDANGLAITDHTNYTLATTGITIGAANNMGANLNVTTAGGQTQYRPAFLCNNNNTTGYLGFSAEL